MTRRTNILSIATEEVVSAIRSNDRVMIGRAITLVESRNPNHISKANEIISALLLDQPETFRVAISGSPGVGKSTFIENLGMMLVEQGHRVAVLSIDPSSDINRGSILGDKTRMDRLSAHPNAFIRPSPAGDFLGGIAWRTREAITICEGAGYDVILIETVGVGQSEFKVRDMADCFFLLLAPGGGDELQGIKKGIVEIADIISINKCDGDLQKVAERTRKDYSQALHLFPVKSNGWVPKVINTSSETGMGLQEAWELMQQMKRHLQANQSFHQTRKEQLILWFKERLASTIYQYVEMLSGKEGTNQLEQDIKSKSINPIDAANHLAEKLLQ